MPDNVAWSPLNQDADRPAYGRHHPGSGQPQQVHLGCWSVQMKRLAAGLPVIVSTACELAALD